MGHPVHYGCSECICIDKSRDRPRSRSRLTCARLRSIHDSWRRERRNAICSECARSLFHPHFRSTQQMMLGEEKTSKWIGSKEKCTPGRFTTDLFYLGWEKAWKRLEYMPGAESQNLGLTFQTHCSSCVLHKQMYICLWKAFLPRRRHRSGIVWSLDDGDILPLVLSAALAKARRIPSMLHERTEIESGDACSIAVRNLLVSSRRAADDDN